MTQEKKLEASANIASRTNGSFKRVKLKINRGVKTP